MTFLVNISMSGNKSFVKLRANDEFLLTIPMNEDFNLE